MSPTGDDDAPAPAAQTPAAAGTASSLPPLQIDLAAEVRKSGLAGAYFNFVNSILGAGIIGMPFAIRKSGVLAGVFFLVLVAYLTDVTVRGLVRCGRKLRRLDYEDLMEACYGRGGRLLCMLSMFLMAYGAMIGYSVIIGDTIGTVAVGSDASQGHRALIIFLFSTLTILPLCLLRDMAALSRSSFLSIFSDLVLVLIVAAAAPGAAQDEGIDKSDAGSDYLVLRITTLPTGVSTMAFAFVCQHSSFIVRNSLENPSDRRWAQVTLYSVVTAFLGSAVLGLAGYLAFFDEVEGDVLNSFGDGNVAANVARVLLAVTMCATYPMEQFVARQVLYAAVFKPAGMDAMLEETRNGPLGAKPFTGSEQDDANLLSTLEGAGRSEAAEPLPRRYHYGITLTLWATSTAIAMSTSDLGLVLSLTGALGASMIGFILPAAIFYKASADELHGDWEAWDKSSRQFKKSIVQRVWAVRRFLCIAALFIFGVLLLISGTISSIVGAAT